jgi:hypothetical protein
MCRSLRDVLIVLALFPLAASGEETLRNWFNDPFFQVRDGVRRCPAPLGPLITEARMRTEAHHRTESGTSCWLEKRCAKQNSYLYDPEIAAAVRDRFATTKALPKASLWVTVQGRVVRIEGCVPPDYAEGTLEQLMAGVPDVAQVIVSITSKPAGQAPYPTLKESPR